jgi:hypothetical protein
MIHASAELTDNETLRRAAKILDRLAAGERPSARDLADAPLVESWSIIATADIYRIGAVLEPDRRARPIIVPLLALKQAEKWALVLIDDRIAWWVLGTRLPGTAALEDEAQVLRLATAWTRRR